MEKNELIRNSYEVVVLIHPDSNLQDQKDLFQKNKSIIQSFKGAVNSLETWGKRTLANPIGKQRKAIYFHSTFEAQSGAVAELERTMRINDKVMRFMHTKIDSRMPLTKFMESFKKGLQESAQREKEKEAKAQARRAAAASARLEE
jgi:small subunit ribosomal protein S6